MNAGKSESWKCFLAVGVLLALLMGAVGCGGGGGTTTATVPTATIQGSVSGTIIMAIDETGKIAATDNTSGKTPLPGSSPPKYPFTLTVPVGHQYTIQFIVGEGTSEERLVPLYEGTVNIFSVSSQGKLDLGFVDTSAATAAADNNILLQPGVTSGGATGDNTISLARPGWGYKYVTYFDDSDGSVKARFQVEIRDPSGTSPVTNKSLVRGVAFFDNAWNEYPLNGAFQLWNGSGVQYDSSGTIAPRPMAEVRGILQAAPSTLSERFYNVVVTDNTGNTHTAKVYFRQPDKVPKASSLAQVINTADNSISLSWTNPSFPAGSKYGIWVAVLSNDGNGDGIDDTLLLAQRIPPVSSYTLPAGFVATLAGKSNLRWVVHIRQYDDTTTFPDGSIPGIGNQFYRNYSAEKTLTLPSVPEDFSQADLTGTWDFMQYQTISPAGGGWVRGVVRFDGSGHLIVDDNTTFQSTHPEDSFPNGDSGMIWTVAPSGVITETGDPTTSGFHGNMASNKQLVTATLNMGSAAKGIRILRKRVPGLTYGASDLANKSFVFHVIESGAFVGWERGTGTIDGSGQIRLTSAVDDVGPVTPPVDPNQVVGQFQIDGNGIVSEVSAPTVFKGFLTTDKSTVFLVNTNVENASVSYELLAISLVNPAKTFTLADLAGTYRFHSIWTSPAGWAYGTVVMGSAGSGTISGTEPAGSWDPIPITLSISSDGTVRVTNMDPTFHGTLSPNGDLLISTVTDSFGYGEYSLGILVK